MIRQSTAKPRRRIRECVIQTLEPRLMLCADDGCPDPVASTPIADTSGTAIVQPVASTSTTLSPLGAIPSLNSDPGAPATLYLDFHGEPAENWALQTVPATPAYDIDGDPTTFSSQELANIQEIWARVSEAYSPFNVDVTTVDPGNWDLSGGGNNNHQVREVIGGSGAWTGVSEGGTAYVGSYYSNNLPNTVYVFPANLGNGDPHYTAVDSVHEAGHAFGLQHQSLYSGTTKTNEYNPGNGTTAPFMGNALSNVRATWWDGQSTLGYNVMQDDLSVLSGLQDGFGYKAQDHGQSPSAATPLSVSGASLSGSGIVQTTSDQDYFSFTAPAAGTDTFSVNVAQYGPMLHAILELHDANNNVIAVANNASTLSQTLSLNLAAGNYYLVVKSYGQYGDIGQYTVSGTLAAAPNTPTFAISGASSVNEGAPYTLNLAASDANPVQSWLVNWGDGSAAQTIGSSPTSVTHTYAVGPNNYTITASATDSTGTYSAGNSVNVSVLHVGPQPTISGTSSITEGLPYTLSLSVSDPNHTILSWAINWGDGTVVQTVNGNPSSATHTYASTGSFNVSASVTDDVGSYASNTLAVAVTGTTTAPDTVAPTATAALTNVTAVSSSYTFTVTYSDNVAVSGSTLGSSTVVVSGPKGYTQLATLMGVSAAGNAATLTATYQITPPGGNWSSGANGTYTVSIEPNSVTDTSGNAVPGGTLGSFSVTISKTVGNLSPRKKAAAGAVAGPGTQDLYSFVITQPQIVTINMSSQRDILNVELMNGNMTVLLSRTTRHMSRTITLSPGTYYVQVTFAGTRTTRYQVTMASRPVPVKRRSRLEGMMSLLRPEAS